MRFEDLPTPSFVVDEDLLIQNLEICRGIMERTRCKILLAQKAFSMYELYETIGQYLSGATASGLFEARLGYEEMVVPSEKNGKRCENHVFSPAFKEEEFEEMLPYVDHIVFNSFKQVDKYAARAIACGKEVGLRINPQCSTQKGHEIYDPCAPGSRLGVTIAEFEEGYPSRKGLISGLHFHTLCEQDADDLIVTMYAVEKQFGRWLSDFKWLNFGGGHHITRPGYHIDKLEECILNVKHTYGLQVYLEPGEAVALNAGFIVATVLEVQDQDDFDEIIENQKRSGKVWGALIRNVILDTSAACHMPDVLEMPYRPFIQGSGEPGVYPYVYRLAGPTCLAGDVIGMYSFMEPLKEGDRLVFEDMAIYSMVKTNTFNGMPLPTLCIKRKDGGYEKYKEFGYDDFKMRL